jgi:hypothetical protein
MVDIKTGRKNMFEKLFLGGFADRFFLLELGFDDA